MCNDHIRVDKKRAMGYDDYVTNQNEIFFFVGMREIANGFCIQKSRFIIYSTGQCHFCHEIMQPIIYLNFGEKKMVIGSVFGPIAQQLNMICKKIVR